MFEARLWRERRRLFRPPQHPDHPPHLRECLAPGSLDGEQRLALALLLRPKQPPHSRCLHCHHADAVADDVVQFTRNARAFLRNGVSRTLLAFAFRPYGPLPRLVRLRELAPEREADHPDNREDETDEDELADLAPGIVSDDDRLDAYGDRETRDGLSAVSELSQQEHAGAAGEKG